MRKLILIRHSEVAIDPSKPHHEWVLSESGRRLAVILAERLCTLQPDLIVTSTETKAIQTGQIVAQQMNVPVKTVDDLHEHQRRQMPYTSQPVFEENVAKFFNHPTELVFGSETAEQVYQRFKWAIGALLQKNGGKNLAVISHGTALALFVGRQTKQPPLDIWKQLDSPSYLVLSLPDMRLTEMVTTVRVAAP